MILCETYHPEKLKIYVFAFKRHFLEETWWEKGTSGRKTEVVWWGNFLPGKRKKKEKKGVVQNAVFASCNLKCRVPARLLKR